MDDNSPAAPVYMGASWDCLRDAMESLACGKAFYFDSRGDLVLKVGEAFHEGGQEFVVCSRTVARWSKVFNAMFFGGFAESMPSSRDGTWTVALPEDRIAPVFLILAIIHGPHQSIPTVLGRDELFDLLIVTEKYDMTHILRPWASKWLQNLPLDNSENTTGEYRDVWIAWELGYEVGFSKMLKDILWNCRVDDAGQLLDVHGVPLSTLPCLEPSRILENISNKRAELIEAMIDLLRRTLQKALAGGCCIGYSDGKRYEYDAGPDNPSKFITEEDCDDLFVGSLIRRIRDMRVEEFVLPPAASSSFLGSAYSLRDLIEVEINNGYVDVHDNCDPWIGVQTEVQEMVEKLSSPVTDMHLEYLQNRAKKTGV
ncbi:nuclear pore protein-like protein [Colletotrichum camelliae]|nr:nuclear pore protein-like protein [Colletotrichum camelliae]